MLEALWSIEFVSNAGVIGAGVAIFETGRIFGGDAQYYYTGTFETKGGELDADVEVNHYGGNPYSIFGPATNFKLKLSGKISEPIMEATGYRVDNPNLQVRLRRTRRADLP